MYVNKDEMRVPGQEELTIELAEDELAEELEAAEELKAEEPAEFVVAEEPAEAQAESEAAEAQAEPETSGEPETSDEPAEPTKPAEADDHPDPADPTDLKELISEADGKGTADTKEHMPRPVRPEDESYGELMMRFTAHPVKPKYWFEEFGDHWTCSCGQVNKGETCANCGLERDLLRQLFILHKPASVGRNNSDTMMNGYGTGAEAGINNSAGFGGMSKENGNKSDGDTGSGAGFGAGSAGGAGSGGSGSAGAADSAGQEDEDQVANLPDDAAPVEPRGHKGLVIGIVVVLILLLLGAGAFVYFVVFPEMNAQDKETAEAVRSSLTEHMPEVVQPLPKAQFDAYVAAGNYLKKDGDYVKAIEYYRKALKLDKDPSIKKKILACKYSYVEANQNVGGDRFVKYLNQLVGIGYEGAQSIYDAYYAWDASVVANNKADDAYTSMDSVDKSDTIYFHTTISGGPPDGTIQLYYQIIWPDGSADRKDIDSTYHSGSQITSRFQYPIPLLAKAGKMTFEVYNRGTHELLDSASITLKKPEVKKPDKDDNVKDKEDD